ncbi:hypothetical protein QOZ89_38590 [Pseudofrankia sp. BMG5.37]|uniref:hypothetical protein n=1 Tax=Pseudofrankia sp. BMG5.36 TaxID=1834512 RepID=UPI0008DAF3B1|nr:MULTISPECIES: hypothetical protein [unclassified Pseudofrankia]MDT3445462.1 hypothetical protein [Pseudofrankia sp. BMG5.37]OHV67504.1 hypothetical protein BCD48_35270 [Pseudofrankia sp. BMG5.36]
MSARSRGQSRVDQDEAGHGVRVGCGRQDRDHRTHRVSYQDRGRAHDLSKKPAEQLHVGLDSRASPQGLGQAVAGQVHGQDTARQGQPGREREPVEMGTAKTMHADQQWPALWAPEIDIVRRSVQIDPVRRGINPVGETGRLMADG